LLGITNQPGFERLSLEIERQGAFIIRLYRPDRSPQESRFRRSFHAKPLDNRAAHETCQVFLVQVVRETCQVF
jgi:hypothetical protein